MIPIAIRARPGLTLGSATALGLGGARQQRPYLRSCFARPRRLARRAARRDLRLARGGRVALPAQRLGGRDAARPGGARLGPDRRAEPGRGRRCARLARRQRRHRRLRRSPAAAPSSPATCPTCRLSGAQSRSAPAPGSPFASALRPIAAPCCCAPRPSAPPRCWSQPCSRSTPLPSDDHRPPENPRLSTPLPAQPGLDQPKSCGGRACQGRRQAPGPGLGRVDSPAAAQLPDRVQSARISPSPIGR